MRTLGTRNFTASLLFALDELYKLPNDVLDGRAASFGADNAEAFLLDSVKVTVTYKFVQFLAAFLIGFPGLLSETW